MDITADRRLLAIKARVYSIDLYTYREQESQTSSSITTQQHAFQSLAPLFYPLLLPKQQLSALTNCEG